MDGANRAFAAPTTITLGGVEYTVRPRIAAFYGEMEDHLLSKRENPMQVARESVLEFRDDPDLVRQILEIAMESRCRAKSVTRRELSEWMDSMDGTAFTAWLQIRHNDPNYNESNPAGSCTTITPAFIKAKMLEDFEAALEQLQAEESISRDEAAARAESLVIDRVQAEIGRPSGEDGLGNSTGPTPTAGPGEKTSPSPGGGSSDD